jgi:hypothetical protein
MTQPLPVFTDYVRQVPRQDAEDLRFFVGNMVAPVEVDRDFATHQLSMTKQNKAVHPHLRWRAKTALEVVKFFGNPHAKAASAVFKIKGRDDFVRVVNYNPRDYLDVPPIISSVDHVIHDVSGHVIVPKNPESMCAALRIIQHGDNTNEKFTRFRELALIAIENQYETPIASLISYIENNPGLVTRVKIGHPRPKAISDNVVVFDR